MSSSSSHFSSTAADLLAVFSSDNKDKSANKRISALKKAIAGISYGYDMSSLFPSVISSMESNNLELKKLCYLYLKIYASVKPTEAKRAVKLILNDIYSSNPMIRSLALRTLTSVNIKNFWVAAMDPIVRLLDDTDPYVRKTAAIGIAKLYSYDKKMVESSGLIDHLKEMLSDESSVVVANSLAALMNIVNSSTGFKLTFSREISNKLVKSLTDCSEWLQVAILDALIFYVPQKPGEAESFAERISPWLQHGNAAVCMGAVKVILYLTNYMKDDNRVKEYFMKTQPPLVTLLARKSSATQYVILRNIQIILEQCPEMFANDIHFFYCNFDDPIYVKLEKLDILTKIADIHNLDQILPEFVEYASEIDVELVRKSVKCIGYLAIKIEERKNDCIDSLIELMNTKVTYVIQEAVIVIRDILRKYPGSYKSLVPILYENLDSLDEPDAKSAVIWILGQYAEEIEDSITLLNDYLKGFFDEPLEIQLTLLTAVIKVFLKKPTAAADMVTNVLQWCTDEVNDPDLRDRGIIYSRMLSANPELAKKVILANMPPVNVGTGMYDPDTTEQLMLNISTLSSIYHKPPNRFVKGAQVAYCEPSPVLRLRTRDSNPSNTDSRESNHKKYNHFHQKSQTRRVMEQYDRNSWNPSPFSDESNSNTFSGKFDSADQENLGMPMTPETHLMD
ncbi:AP-2 adaptor complex beta subunit Apl1 [Schizosaccharomyces pombe]|uniref:AP-2 complex subunit beta n=1 Tax=Schizosaccharomyces pombe (strain 972 / ATCC 24843) TaxID=284812 RepID=AP2B_SCHPO|nr:putative AP-2 adaptor complex subunit Apl1 [Schizosaccharomyces pombe]O43005.1 RecName: Full=AP-2 complex subunit beta; AltName: Full=Beta-2-adaptin; AltName: Full=Beta-adaptin; AltName: Full=Clathrin assembly protein complex 2 beta large chain; AltName: Full=Clathrin assembly protein large beta chain [Schizosaccharomyces pombe 972h-]CAA17886.1 AP-2 adaptor complex subunit Apl1 (predicted) [Schizosaccharomyces pombe]|eukprot:NP_596435.1 putative AP-2 adaptor complex subunit Apl1 [Schizosaccharomyces pombe]